MGKFAGFLKRAKKLAGIGSGILGGINDIYKQVKPLVNTAVGFLQGGSFINQGWDIASNVVDKIQPYTKNWIMNQIIIEFNQLKIISKELVEMIPSRYWINIRNEYSVIY